RDVGEMQRRSGSCALAGKAGKTTREPEDEHDNRKRIAAAQAARAAQPPLMPAMAASVLRKAESWLQRASMRSFAALVLALV
ncbi:hypothetical protein ACC791_37345, partial [Rhizobium ruizarguesonis]